MPGFRSSVYLLLLLGGVMSATSGRLPAAEKEARVLRHLVLYQFKPDITPAQLKELIDAFAGLPKQIDAIIDFEHGPNVSPEGKSEGLTYCFMVTFRDEQSRDAYLVHPAHKAYVKVAQDKRQRAVVVDYWATP